MSRRAAVLALIALVGCQSYNFNPVGKCVIQPGTTQLTLAGIDTADILFVVDDSGSMAPSQQNLADNFGAFIAALKAMQDERTSRGLQALNFHIAITTSSVYENLPASGAICSSTPQGPQCTYRSQANDPQAPQVTNACGTVGEVCGDFVTRYYGTGPGGSHAGCIPGVGAVGLPYPGGDFVAAPGNPKVLQFRSELWQPGREADIADLVQKFQQNIAVGTCGSGQEQPLEAARLAIEKAQRGAQPGVAPGDFPHPGAKLVVVYVGDEDDCSGPADPARALVAGEGFDLQDACVRDWLPANRAQSKQIAVIDYANHLLGLARPLGAAFIYSGTPGPAGRLQPGLCGCPAGSSDPNLCTGKSSGTRLFELSTFLGDRGVGVVEASICDQSFATALQSIAELVRPPAGLQLPSTPAANEVAVLRIVAAGGGTARVCRGPAPDADWWFVDCADTTGTPLTTPTSCVAIRAGSACEANPGETYSAEYLGVVPAPSASNPLGGCGTAAAESSECAGMLGGRTQDWSCDIPSGVSRGTCLCNAAP